MRLADARVFGIFPLQHEKFATKGWDIQLRASILGVRIVDRLTGPGQVGHWVIDKDSAGDIHGGQLWKKASREIPMWRFATPVVVGAGGQGMNGSGGDSPGAPPPAAGFVFSGVRTNFSNGGPQAGASFTDPANPPDANAATYGFGPPPGSSQPPGGLPGAQRPPGAPPAEPPDPNNAAAANPVATGEGQGPSGAKCGTKNGITIVPVFNDSFTGDDRLQAITPAMPKPKKGQKGWPKFPDGTFGVSLTGNDEGQQVDFFLPTEPRLVAVNFAGDKDMGSPVFDLTEKFEYDGERSAPLQSMMRVVKKPLGGANVLAWQLGPSGCGDTHGGYVFDKKTDGTADAAPPGPTASPGSSRPPVQSGVGASSQQGIAAAQTNSFNSLLPPGGPPPSRFNVGPGGLAQQTGVPNAPGSPSPVTDIGSGRFNFNASTGGLANQFANINPPPGAPVSSGPGGGGPPETGLVVARSSRNNGGPLDVGSGKCKHVVGRDGDGNPISRLHISHDFLLRQNDIKDGPLNITNWEQGVVQDRKVVVQFGWNPKLKKWDWWTTAYVYYSPPYSPPPPPYPPPPYPPPPTPPVPPPTASTPPTPPTPPTSPPTSPPSPPPSPPATPPIPPKYAPVSTGDRYIRETENETVYGMNAGYLMTNQAMASGEMLSKPYSYAPGAPETRYAANLPPGSGEKRNAEGPVTAVMAAFGAEGGSAATTGSIPPAPSPPSALSPPSPPGPVPPPPPSPIASPPPTPPTSAPPSSPTNIGSTGDPWNYTHKPGKARFQGGTSNGGWVVLPPEVGLELKNNGLVPKSNAPTSEAYFGVGPGAKFFAAIPDMAKGRPKDGISWGMDTSNGDLIFNSHFTGDAAIPLMRLGRTSQRIGFRSRSAYYGNFAHFNNAERNWIFPDVSGDVIVGESFPLVDVGATATLGGIGGAGPTWAGQYAWIKIFVNGTYFFIPMWI